MARRWTNDLTWADVTPKALWLNRRQIMAGAGVARRRGPGGRRGLAQEALEPNTLEEITDLQQLLRVRLRQGGPRRPRRCDGRSSPGR